MVFDKVFKVDCFTVSRMIYNKKEKETVRGSLKSLLDASDKLNFLTKTRFLNELEKKTNEINKNKIYLKNILNYILSDLEGDTVLHLKEKLLKNTAEAMNLIYKSEKEILKNTLKQVKNKYIILADEKTPLSLYLLQLAKENKKFDIVLPKDKKNFEHVDLALIPIDKIDSKANMFTNKNYKHLLEKAKKFDIPVYGYIHSLKFIPKINQQADKTIIKPNLVKSIISELGIFEPEIFVQELKLNYPWLLK